MIISRPERHLDPSAAGSPLATLPGFSSDDAAGSTATVTVVVGTAAATTARGQLLTWATVNLLLRCYGALSAVTVYSPDAKLVEPLPALDGTTPSASTMHQGMTDLGRALNDPQRNHPRLVLTDARPPAAGRATATLLIGTELLGVAVPTSRVARSTWLLCASNWKATVICAAGPHVDPRSLPQLDAYGNVMVAAWFAAAVGVSEVFKVIGRVRADAGRLVDVFCADLWRGTVMDSLEPLAAPDGPSTGLTLPPHWLVGAGAVGISYLAALSTSKVDTDIAVLDDDDLDDLNLNRHIVAGITDVGLEKAQLARDRLSNPVTRIVPLKYTWQSWTMTHPNDKPPLPLALEQQSRGQRYELLISAVDKNPARISLAGAYPQLIFGASTNGMTVEVGRYGRDSPWQCLGCNSLVAAQPTVEQTAARLAVRTDSEIDVDAARAGVDAGQLRAYLSNPVCGTLGEQEIQKFASFTSPDWSVSFVSVAAGTLLAARVLRHAHGIATGDELLAGYPPDGDTVRLWMLKSILSRTAHQRRTNCPICHGIPDDHDDHQRRSKYTW